MCHQTVSLAARHLEDNGIPTVIMGCAKDIVEHAGVPRFVFSDFPLGNSAGRPFDVESQRQTLELALTRPPRFTPLSFPLRADRLQTQTLSTETWRERVQREAQRLERLAS